MARNTGTALGLAPGEIEAEIVYARRAQTAHQALTPSENIGIHCSPHGNLVAAPRQPCGAAYNFSVARGWESKSVELQQDDARSTGEPKRQLTPEQKEIESRKEGLKLSRSRILEQLHATQNPLYRKTLEQALATIEDQITRLG